MGAAESKKWLELMSETPTKPENKRLGKIHEIEDPRSPSCQLPRTPIHLQTYEESPQNLELRIPDPRSPTLQISRTPLNLPTVTDNKSRKNDLRKTVLEQETDKECDSKAEVLSDEQNSITVEPPSPISPGAPLTKKDKANLLKKTVSPADFKRKTKKRSSTRRQSVPQKLFSESVEPAPRSPLAQHNSLDDGKGRTGKKGKKYSSGNKKISVQYEELWDAGKENARTPMVQ